MLKDILICTFVVAAAFIIELRFEKKVDHDEQWKQQMSQDIKDIKTSTKRLANEYNVVKNKVDSCDIYLMSGYGRESVSIIASSSYNANHGPELGFLNTKHGVGSWCAGTNDRNQYLQVELPFMSRITGIATQKRHGSPQWVTSYRVYYSKDCSHWELIGGGNGREFIGNNAGDDIKKNYFDEPVKAKCIRVNPLTWQQHVSMRMDIIGCRI